MFEDIQVVYMSVRILKFWSLIYDHNCRRYLCLISTTLLYIAHFAYIILTEEWIGAKIRNAYTVVLWTNTVTRGYLLVYKSSKIEKFLSNLQFLYYEIKKDGDKYIQGLLNETNLLGKRMAWLNFFLGIVTCIGLGSSPWFASERVLPFGIILPGIDEYKSPFYEIVYVIQIIVALIGCCMYIPFTSLIVAFIMFAVVMCKVLQHRLRTLKQQGDSNKTISTKLIWCINYQNKIIRYIKTVDQLTTYIFLLEFLAFRALLCALLFLLVIVDSAAQTVIVFVYITMTITQIFALYYYANELYQQTFSVAAAAYETNWFEFEIPAQKYIMLIILRAQKPCTLTVGKMNVMSLEMFQSTLNSSYSYFTLLRRVYG